VSGHLRGKSSLSRFSATRDQGALPLTAVIDALRAIMLQGANLARLAPQLGVLGAWLIVCFVLAMKLFRWR
jgi:hypothetical protein